MATQARRAQGTLLKLGDGGSPESFTTIAELTKIDTTFKADDLDASNHDTPSSWKEFVPGMKEAEIKIAGNFIPEDATQDATTGLLSHFIAGDQANYQLIFPGLPGDPSPLEIDAAMVVMEMSPKADAKAILTFDASLKFAGAPTFV